MPADVVPEISVIIPTHNRRASLLHTLESLRQQTLPADRFEVVVVDDGCTDGTHGIRVTSWPFSLRYLRQENQGGVKARNRGAAAANGDVLIFLDDDMALAPDYVSALASQFSDGRHLLARGRLEPWVDHTSLFARSIAAELDESCSSVGDFCSNNLAILADDFWALGGWIDLLPDTSEHRGGIWSDLEFTVRAYRNGYQLITVPEARIVHRDYASRDLDSACDRAYMVSRLAVPVVDNHPELVEHLQMLHDKHPIDWRTDSSALVARKLARQAVSSPPALRNMESLVGIMERHHPSPAILERLYRWIVSAYVYRGYRQGLQELDAKKSSLEWEQKPDLGTCEPGESASP